MCRGRLRPSLAPALLVLALGCTAQRTFLANPGLYDRIPSAWAEPLEEARKLRARENLDDAYEILSELAAAEPRILPVRVALQDLEIELLTKFGRAGAYTVPSADDALPMLAERYLFESEANPSPETLVLAARLAIDPRDALLLLRSAGQMDPSCVWVPYARAWWNLVDFRFTAAESAVRDAFRLDPGHLPTMRLYAIVLTASGQASAAVEVLEKWLKRMRRDPLASPAKVAEGYLDLASLKVLAGKNEEALRLLEDTDTRALESLERVWEVRAAAHQGRGDLDLALEAVRVAQEVAPESALPLVQRAMIMALDGNVEAELHQWEELLRHEEGEDGGGFSTLLYRIQALVRLQRAARLEAELEEGTPNLVPGGPRAREGAPAAPAGIP